MDIKEILRKTGLGTNDKLELLAGDASTRKYYRAGSSEGSYIIMQGDPYDISDPNIVNYNILKKAGIRIPEFIKIEPKHGVLIEEDLGSVHLQDIKDCVLIDKYYHMAIKNMQTYHRCRSDVSFTEQKFISELDMTIDSYVRGYLGKKELAPDLVDAVNEKIVKTMMDQPQAYLHRDYHSRNIMIKDDDIVLIDFQDARMGPYAYDIASLTIDPYIDLDDVFRDKLVSLYYELVAAPIFGVEKDEYMEHYYVCYLQRGIKMLGTFAHQSLSRGKNAYLEYIPETVSRIRSVSKIFPEWSDIIEGVYLP